MSGAGSSDEDERVWTDWFPLLTSWTFALADWRKRGLRDAARSRVIARMNTVYLLASIGLLLLLMLLSWNDLPSLRRMVGGTGLVAALLRFVIGSYCLSRCIEVFYAFYRDAFAKLAGEGRRSDLVGRTRIGLALRSYVELIVDFGLLYSVMSADAWQPASGGGPTRVTDALFYSASTITTSGGGGFVPEGILLQILTSFEIGCGLILLVVCFAVYAS